MLPANAKEYVVQSPHLLEYLLLFPVNTYGIPLFFSELKRDLKGMENPNIIYPAGNEIFIHIFPDQNDVRNFYIPIEPSFLHGVVETQVYIEEKIIDVIDKLKENPITEEERAKVLKKVLREIIYIRKPGESFKSLKEAAEEKKGIKNRITSFLNKDFSADLSKNKIPDNIPMTSDGKFILSIQEYRSLEYLFIRDKIEMGVLKPFLSDPYIEDITCDGVGPIFIEHKIFKGWLRR